MPSRHGARCAILVLTAALLSAGASRAEGPLRRPSAAPELARGERLFGDECAACHGPAGEGGRGPMLAVPRLTRAADWDALTKLIGGGVEGTEMPAARLEQQDVARVAAWVLRLGRRPVQKVPGDPARGERIYRERGGCALCHAVGGVGGALGPDLTDIGLRRGAAHLRRSLLAPEEDLPRSFSTYRSDVSISQNFLAVRLLPREGREIEGVRVNEDTFSIQVRDVAGQIHSFFKSDLRELHKDWGRSPMPSYEGAFAAAELDDLVAFLVSLRGPR
jgi:cytochrome c oxidase cbb3-type subunit 3